MTIAGVIVSMILGYQFSFSGMDPEFASDSLEKMVKNAAQNAKSSVSNVVKTITNDEKMKKGHMQFELNINKNDQKKPEKDSHTNDRAVFGNEPQELRDQAKELEETMDSFFESNPAATTYHSAYSAATSSVPTIQVPVQTETKEGEVSIDDDQDGFSSVTIG